MKTTMNKGRRNELRNLKWKKRLKNYRLSGTNLHIFRDQGKPCSCPMCSPNKYKRAQKHKGVINDENIHT